MNIKYSIRRHRRARRVSITVRHTGDVVVTLPLLAPAFTADKFVREKLPWIEATQRRMKKRFENKIVIKQTRKNYLDSKKKALEFITERLGYYNKFYNFKIGRISIKNHKSRWGSCSSKGNLNFNYTLVHLPQELADYVVVHELCHIKELNHSQKFWNLVAQTIPDYKARRAILKKKYISIA
jgi:predicted metal-dependent hydrolase